MLYFGYGSNMSKARLEERVGSFERLGAAYVTGYALRFHKKSRKDGSGKCDAFYTGTPGDRLWGALDRLTDAQIAELDGIEGRGYRRASTTVMFGEEPLQAALYLARPEAIDTAARPLRWYKDCVVVGARELNLPADYIDAVEAVSTMPDPQ